MLPSKTAHACYYPYPLMSVWNWTHKNHVNCTIFHWSVETYFSIAGMANRTHRMWFGCTLPLLVPPGFGRVETPPDWSIFPPLSNALSFLLTSKLIGVLRCIRGLMLIIDRFPPFADILSLRSVSWTKKIEVLWSSLFLLHNYLRHRQIFSCLLKLRLSFSQLTQVRHARIPCPLKFVLGLYLYTFWCQSLSNPLRYLFSSFSLEGNEDARRELVNTPPLLLLMSCICLIFFAKKGSGIWSFEWQKGESNKKWWALRNERTRFNHGSGHLHTFADEPEAEADIVSFCRFCHPEGSRSIFSAVDDDEKGTSFLVEKVSKYMPNSMLRKEALWIFLYL